MLPFDNAAVSSLTRVVSVMCFLHALPLEQDGGESAQHEIGMWFTEVSREEKTPANVFGVIIQGCEGFYGQSTSAMYNNEYPPPPPRLFFLFTPPLFPPFFSPLFFFSPFSFIPSMNTSHSLVCLPFFSNSVPFETEIGSPIAGTPPPPPVPTAGDGEKRPGS